jgi:hypothetical protein
VATHPRGCEGVMAKDRATEHRDRAEECRRAAEAAIRERDKAAWLTLAEHWERLAEPKGPSRPPRRSLACAAALAKRSIGHARTEAAPAAVLQRQAEPIGAGARCHHRRRNHPRPRTAPAPAV